MVKPADSLREAVAALIARRALRVNAGLGIINNSRFAAECLMVAANILQNNEFYRQIIKDIAGLHTPWLKNPELIVTNCEINYKLRIRNGSYHSIIDYAKIHAHKLCDIEYRRLIKTDTLMIVQNAQELSHDYGDSLLRGIIATLDILYYREDIEGFTKESYEYDDTSSEINQDNNQDSTDSSNVEDMNWGD